MSITVEDIRREVKEKKCNLYSVDVLRYLRNHEKTLKFQRQMNSWKRFSQTRPCLMDLLSKGLFGLMSLICISIQTWTLGLFFPWGDENGSVAGLICDVYTTEGEPFAGDPRGNLKRALRHMEEVGFKSFNLGPEPEFFLFKLDENGDPTLEVNDKGWLF